jgi:hypothetical protein
MISVSDRHIFDADPDLDLTFYFDVVPNAEPSPDPTLKLQQARLIIGHFKYT